MTKIKMVETTERITLNYKNLSSKWSTQHTDYNRQYCSIYLARLKDMEQLLREQITSKFKDKYPICKLHKLTESNYEKCIVFGTLFKDQKLKPSVLKHLAEGNQLVPQPVLTHFTDESDVLFIEDEVQRYRLQGNISGENLVTGITCALLGKDLGKGKFEVEQCIFAGYREQIECPLFNDPAYIVFLSGLDFVNQANIAPNLELLAYWLSGMFGNSETVSKIARVIIAGNSIRTVPQKSQPTISMTSRIPETNDTIEAVKSFDYFLLKLCEVIDVDIMPGANDPSNHILPQIQMHYCMFPQSSVYKTLNQVPNPYSCSVNDGLMLLGSSGQNVTDILRFSEITDPLEALESCLKWNHLAPTAPDTLGCFPYYDNDPFIIEKCPHVFFVGNQEKFSTKICEGENGQKVRLLSIPEFSKTFEAVILNLKSLECHTVSFRTS